MFTEGQIFRISVSSVKGTKKKNVSQVWLQEGLGIVGDAHAGSARQVSLLPYESFAKVWGEAPDVRAGDFAENITTVGFSLGPAAIGRSLFIGESIKLVVTHIGKTCHHGCFIKELVGDCIMPREGIFASVAVGGAMRVGDKIVWAK